MCCVTIKIIISLFLTAISAGLNAYIISVFKVAHEHVLQPCTMLLALCICSCAYMSTITQRFLQYFDLLQLILTDLHVFHIHLKIISGVEEFRVDFILKN